MVVATAAATTIASRAESARPRRNIAARTNIRRNIDLRGFPARRAEGRELKPHLAVHTPDQNSSPAKRQRHSRQRSRSPRLPGSEAGAPVPQQYSNRKSNGQSAAPATCLQRNPRDPRSAPEALPQKRKSEQP